MSVGQFYILSSHPLMVQLKKMLHNSCVDIIYFYVNCESDMTVNIKKQIYDLKLQCSQFQSSYRSFETKLKIQFCNDYEDFNKNGLFLAVEIIMKV